MDTLFSDSVERLFAQISTPAAIRAIENGSSPEAMWSEIDKSGFLDALVPESLDGAGLALAQVFPMFLSAGRHAVPLPFAQTMLARAWLASAGVAPPSGPISITGMGVRSDNGAIDIDALPFGRVSAWVLADLGGQAALLPQADASSVSTHGRGGLSASLRWETWPSTGIKMPASISGNARLDEMAAASYAALMAGAADRVLAMTLDYANQRSQFGKHIGKFQAIQNQISIMAERTWAARMAAQLACQSTDWIPRPSLAALGKARSSEAAGLIADIAHAVHGAIGVTDDYDLQLYTRRLRVWRLCAGAESYWTGRIGAQLMGQPQTSALAFICGQLSMETEPREG